MSHLKNKNKKTNPSRTIFNNTHADVAPSLVKSAFGMHPEYMARRRRDTSYGLPQTFTSHFQRSSSSVRVLDADGIMVVS